MAYTVYEILKARVPYSRGSSQPRDQTQVSCIAGGFFTSWATREAQIIIRPIIFNNQRSQTSVSGVVPSKPPGKPPGSN